MTARFADTSYFLALLIPNDENHSAALALAAKWTGLLVTTDWILVEVANHLSSRHTREIFSRFVQAIAAEPRMAIVESSRELLNKGMSLYQSRADKDWSLTDCISFVVMREHALTESLSADRHFEQAGFAILMK